MRAAGGPSSSMLALFPASRAPVPRRAPRDVRRRWIMAASASNKASNQAALVTHSEDVNAPFAVVWRLLEAKVYKPECVRAQRVPRDPR